MGAGQGGAEGGLNRGIDMGRPGGAEGGLSRRGGGRRIERKRKKTADGWGRKSRGAEDQQKEEGTTGRRRGKHAAGEQQG
jgi:hypothetical protein